MAVDETQKIGSTSDVDTAQWRVLRTSTDSESEAQSPSTAADSEDRSEPMKRINLNLPAPVFRELQTLAKGSGRTMTELIRFALGLLHFAFTESRENRKLAVTDSRGRVIKEVVLPW